MIVLLSFLCHHRQASFPRTLNHLALEEDGVEALLIVRDGIHLPQETVRLGKQLDLT